jgi:hypothetical protein
MCTSCGTKENIVHSGTDALLLGCIGKTGQICFTCARS